jgi:hypothetical protein
MGLISFLRDGTWTTRSKSDPRWNMEGRGQVGMLTMPLACKEAIEAKKFELGEEPPDDLEWSYMKD